MPRFGAHAFVWEGAWDADAARRAVRAAAEAGLDFIEIPVLKPRAFDAQGTAALLADHGIAATVSLGLPADGSFPDEAEAAVAFLDEAVEAAARIGSPIVTGVVYGSLGVLPGHPPTDEELAIVADGLRRVARRAGTLGLSLGIEPVNRYESHLVNVATQGLELIDRIGEDNVVLHLDTYHMNIEEHGFADPIELAGARLGYVHLSESDRGVPGRGNVAWDDVFRGLAAVGFTGDMVLESFVAVNEDIARATCMWRSVTPDPETLIREGKAFLERTARRHGVLRD